MIRMLALLALLGLAAGPVRGQDAKPKPTRDKWNVAIVVHEKVELLDFSGPGEALAAAAGGRAFKIYTVAESTEPVTSQGFVKIIPQYTFANCPKPDIVLIPGGETMVLLRSAAAMKFVKETAKEAEVMMSVCTGAFVLAEAGLLDGHEATTHASSISGLKGYKEITVRPDKRVVDNGKTITTGGVSAGIDGALHLTARLCGAEVAKKTAKYMEYKWTPEETKETGELPPETKTLHAWLGGDWKAAGEGYAAIVAKNPADGVAHARLGFCQIREKKLTEAEASTTKAIECGHVTGEVHGQMGWVRMLQKKPAEATACYEKAMAAGFMPYFVWFDLSRAYALTDQKDKALTTLEKAYKEKQISDTGGPLVDKDYESIRGDARFGAIFKKYAVDSKVRIARDDEPGDKLVVSGVVKGPDGLVANALVYVYHTDTKGVYTPGKSSRDPTPRYFAYLRTDHKGRYEYRTIRPASYPNSDIPQHVHYEVWADGHKDWHGEMHFADDPKLPKGFEAAKVAKDKDGVDRCTFDVTMKK